MAKRASIDWPEVAERFAAKISHAALHPGAMLAARSDSERETRRNARHKPRYAVAFSGGADSLALLLILWAEGPGRWGRDFTVLHFNHRLRGRAADADEKFALCVHVRPRRIGQGDGHGGAKRVDAEQAEPEAAARLRRLHALILPEVLLREIPG